MKGANAHKEKQRSRLERLNDRIVRANRLVGRYAHLSWLGACWLFPYARWFYLAIVHVGTVLGIAYLVWDSLFQTTIALSVVYSDALTGLENPISVQNKSNLFWVRNIVWTCHIQDAEYEGNSAVMNSETEYRGSIDVIAPGQAKNIACQKNEGTRLFKFDGAKLRSAHIAVDMAYDADFFGMWYYPRRIHIPFRWVGNIAQPQWVQWDFVK